MAPCYVVGTIEFRSRPSGGRQTNEVVTVGRWQNRQPLFDVLLSFEACDACQYSVTDKADCDRARAVSAVAERSTR